MCVCLIFRICLPNPCFFAIYTDYVDGIDFLFIKRCKTIWAAPPTHPLPFPQSGQYPRFDGESPSQPNTDVHKARLTKSPSPTSAGSHIYDDTNDANLQHCCQLEKKRDVNSPGGAGEVIINISYY